jgi:invasion protein IalB
MAGMMIKSLLSVLADMSSVIAAQQPPPLGQLSEPYADYQINLTEAEEYELGGDKDEL